MQHVNHMFTLGEVGSQNLQLAKSQFQTASPNDRTSHHYVKVYVRELMLLALLASGQLALAELSATGHGSS